MAWGNGVDWIGSGEEKEAISCKHNNEFSGFIKSGHLLNQLSDY
jgi:hypothetical protein